MVEAEAFPGGCSGPTPACRVFGVTVTGGFSNGGALYVDFIVAAGTANIGSVTNNG